MGIYYGSDIYGIGIYNFNDDGVVNTLFEKTYDKIMTRDLLEEAKVFYDNLEIKNNVFIKMYTECSSTYGGGVFMDWMQITKDMFLEKMST